MGGSAQHIVGVHQLVAIVGPETVATGLQLAAARVEVGERPARAIVGESVKLRVRENTDAWGVVHGASTNTFTAAKLHRGTSPAAEQSQSHRGAARHLLGVVRPCIAARRHRFLSVVLRSRFVGPSHTGFGDASSLGVVREDEHVAVPGGLRHVGVHIIVEGGAINPSSGTGTVGKPKADR